MTASDDACQFLGEDLVWRQFRPAAWSTEGRPILFLDRDGVLVEEVDYLHRIEDVRIVDGAAGTIAAAVAAGWATVMITNQAGIGRGYYDWATFAAVNRFILQALDDAGAPLDAVLAAPHHAEGIGPYRHESHPMRKPNPGMLLHAAQVLRANLEASMVVGDNASDLEAGRRAGLALGFHVLTGHGPRYRAASEALATQGFDVRVIDDVGAAALRGLLALHGAGQAAR